LASNTPHARYFGVASYQNLDNKSTYKENEWKFTSRIDPATVRLHMGVYYSSPTTKQYINYYREFKKINLNNLINLGYFSEEPTKDQLDAWYRDYITSRPKSSGIFKSREFIENNAEFIFKDRQLLTNPNFDNGTTG